MRVPQPRPPQFSAHIGYMFSNLPLERRFAAAAAAGFAFVEHPSPYELPAERICQLLAAEGLGFIQLAFPLGDASKGEKGFACIPGRESEFRASLRVGLDLAEAIGCRFVHVQSGIAPPGVDPRILWETYTANLAHAAERAASRNLTVIVEAIGKATIADYYLNEPYMAVKAAKACGRNVALLFDAFHAVNDGIDPIMFIEEHFSAIAHIHIADHPGRHEPGTGRMDFTALFGALSRVGYEGVIGCEYIPAGDTVAGLGWLEKYR